jgi:chaperone modulatory protein CbpM
MMQIDSVIAAVPDLDAVEVVAWVERGWVRPDGAGGTWTFTEIDIARIRLVRDLRQDLGVPDDTIPLVLSLMDQVYELRGALKAVRAAIEQQPDPVRTTMLATLLR